MLHYLELINPGLDSGMPGGRLLGLGVIPIDGNIVDVRVRREFATSFGGTIYYDVRTGVNSAALSSIFGAIPGNQANMPAMAFGTLEAAPPNPASLPVAVTALQTVGFYRNNSNTGGGGNRQTCVIVIDDGLLNETEIEVTTASLADLAESNITAPLGKAFVLSAIETDVEARVTVYRSPAYRTADAARPIGTLPTGDHGVIVDINNVAPGKLNLSPIMYGATAETPRDGDIAIRVQNRSGGATPVEVKFTVNKLEA